jgi:HEAT repeat protein
MFKILPDSANRLRRRLADGPAEQRVKAMRVTHELGLADAMRDALVRLCADPNPRLRSKAVGVLGEAPAVGPEVLIERLMNDADPRVRANAIEVLEAKGDRRFLPVLAERARAANGRERANAIKALHAMKVSTAGAQLLAMLRDPRAEHRVSAMWALREIGWWHLLNEVGRLAREDGHPRVRRYALGVLRGVAEMVAATKAAAKQAG